jgi:hypothetical protein
MLPSGVSLKVGNKDLSYIDNLNLEVSDVTPGGFDSCTFQTDDKRLIPYLKLGNVVQVYDANYQKWPFIGKVREVSLTGYCCNVSCSRSTRDQRFRTLLDPLGRPARPIYTAGTLIEDVLRSAMGLVSSVGSGSISSLSTGIQLVEDTQDFSGQTFEDVAAAMTALTNQFGTPLSWWVHGENSQEVIDVRYIDPVVPRYRVSLPVDQVQQRYSIETIANRSTIEWGKDQSISVPDAIKYDVIPIIRDKYVNSSRTVGTQQVARSLAEGHLQRFSELRDVGGTITIKQKDRVRAIPPASMNVNDDYPHWLVESGWAIDIGFVADLAPFNKQYKFIVSKRYNFTSCELVLGVGEPVGFDTKIDEIVSFEVDRLYKGSAFGTTSWPLADGDMVQTYGPEYDGNAPPSFSAGIPIFVKAKDDALAPNGAVIHPNVIADEGLEANFVVGDLQQNGYKGAVKVIPGEFDFIEILLGNDNGLVDDTCTIVLHKLLKGSSAQPQGFVDIRCSGKRTQRQLTSHVILGKGDWILPQVTVHSSQTTAGAVWASISLHAKKAYPGLKL